MKKYLIMAMAAAAITSCSQDEVMEVAEKQAISFKDAFVENATRAIDGTYNSETLPTSFKVYGNTTGTQTDAPTVPIFAGVEVKKGGTGTGINYKYDAQYTQYWITGNTYNFAAVVDGIATTDANGMPKTITYDATVDGNQKQKDLLYAANTGITGQASGNNDEVEFTFDHLLSKAMFTVKNVVENNNTYYYRVSNVMINDVYKTGTYEVAIDENDKPVGIWKVETENKTLDVNFGNIVATNANTAVSAINIAQNNSGASNYERLFIPATYEGLEITCTIETLIKQGENYPVIETENYKTTINHTFVQGHSYNFLLKIGNPGDPIMFTVKDVNDWLNGNTTDSDDDDDKKDHVPAN